MKNIATYFTMFAVLAFIIAGCGHGGQVTVSSSGTDGEVSIESYTDSTGVSLDGGTIDPTKAIIATFGSAVTSITVAMTCDGVVQDLTVMPLSETQFSIIPTSGRFPQKTTCDMSINAVGASATSASVSATSASTNVNKSIVTQTFEIGCDTLDMFDNSKTLDRTAASLAYGSGCWKINLEDVPIGDYLMLGGLLEIDGATGAGEFEFAKYPMVAKRISGEAYGVTLETADIVEKFPEIAADDRIQIFMILSPNLYTLYDEVPSFSGTLSVTVSMDWDEENEHTNYKITVRVIDGVETVVEAEEDIGHFDDVPFSGFIKEGNIVTPFFSVDSGVTKSFFDIEGSANVDMSQYFGDEDALDVGIFVIAREHQTVATVFIDAFNVEGDASFVAE